LVLNNFAYFIISGGSLVVLNSVTLQKAKFSLVISRQVFIQILREALSFKVRPETSKNSTVIILI